MPDEKKKPNNLVKALDKYDPTWELERQYRICLDCGLDKPISKGEVLPICNTCVRLLGE